MIIHDFARNGDANGVRSQLANGVAVDARDENDYTPLAYAVSSLPVSIELLSLLLDAGADVNARVEKSKTFPLNIAACNGNLEATRYLLNAGADANAASAKGYTALINCIYKLHDSELLLSVIDELINHGAKVDCETDYGELPVTVATRLNRFDAVTQLLVAGANKTPLNWSNLAEAVAVGTVDDVANVLQNDGLDCSPGCFGLTPGLLTSMTGSVEKGQLLLDYGWDVNERGRQEETPLMCCASADEPQMAAWLLENGAEVDLVDDSKNTGLVLASQAGSASCVRLLLDAGADPSLRNDYDETAMSTASTVETVRLLQWSADDFTSISTEMKRALVGISDSDSLNCSADEYREGKRRRFGASNPQAMDIPFWSAMVRAGCSAYHARAAFDDTDSLDEPVWCFSRYGCSFTELPDGRFVQIAGEHEDYYDPDFCIYNDVIVHEAPGSFSIYGYPEGVFRPTDFHTATYFDGYLYLVGCLGYHGMRELGTTPVYRLSCTDWSIESVETDGESPGWIYKHTARLNEPGELLVEGGTVGREKDGEEVHEDLEGSYVLNLETLSWTRDT